jgi:uncharacterized lipoprotein YajG
LLAGCGAAHLRPQEQAAAGLAQQAVIGAVTVASQEEAAKSNPELQKKLAEWQVYAREQLREGLASRGYQVVEAGAAPAGALVWDLDADVQYGNRALRYFVGFGAGKGHVRTTLVVRDAAKQEKYRAGADSDLAMNVFGGDMGKVLRTNITKLVGALPAPTP